MTTLTHENTLPIPTKVLDLLGLKPGDKIAFELNQKGQVLLKPIKEKKVKGNFARLLGTAKTALTTDQIMALTRGEHID